MNSAKTTPIKAGIGDDRAMPTPAPRMKAAIAETGEMTGKEEIVIIVTTVAAVIVGVGAVITVVVVVKEEKEDKKSYEPRAMSREPYRN